MHVLPVYAPDVLGGQWHGRPAFLDFVTMPEVVRVVEVGESCTHCPSLPFDMLSPYNPALGCV